MSAPDSAMRECTDEYAASVLLDQASVARDPEERACSYRAACVREVTSWLPERTEEQRRQFPVWLRECRHISPERYHTLPREQRYWLARRFSLACERGICRCLRCGLMAEGGRECPHCEPAWIGAGGRLLIAGALVTVLLAVVAQLGFWLGWWRP